ncbi:M28 family peptidase [Alteromonas sp. AMM-1]|uniref:M28 family peptidase n=1 Tax=Alteromonas sp. AMM-1 TaxID=3394233 RepID=UPI0039A55873
MKLSWSPVLWLLMWISCSLVRADEQPRWVQDVHYLASDELEGRLTGSEGARRSREFIIDRYETLNISPLSALSGYTQPFTLPDRKDRPVDGINVVGENAGRDAPYIVVTAHYDHLGRKGRRVFNGADDNASGVAAMLEIALRTKRQPMQCNWIFLASDAEEHGLLGAKAFVSANIINKEKVFGNLNLDMLSQPGGRYELLVSGVSSHPQFAGLANDIEIATGVRMNNTDSALRVGRYPVATDRTKVSDHAIFAEQDIPFLFLGVGRHNYYHTPRDTASRINVAFYSTMVEASWQYAKGLDALCAESMQADAVGQPAESFGYYTTPSSRKRSLR